MFTGLIEATARIARVDSRPPGRVLRCDTSLGAALTPGDSIALNGVCLTVVRADAVGFEVDLSPETLRVTTLGQIGVDRLVNLERPLRADARLGGHFVLGHVDAVGRLVRTRDEGDHHWIDVAFPPELEPVLIPKGSIAVDGISLTIAALEAAVLSVTIIPHTYRNTTLGGYRPGARVNLECDILAKHVEKLLRKLDLKSPMTVEKLREQGF